MDKELNINVEEYLKRKDAGVRRGNYKYDMRIGMYNFAGQLECVFENLTDAVENNTVGATYKGILACVKHEIKKHAGKIWRKEETDSSADVLPCVKYDPAVCMDCDLFDTRCPEYSGKREEGEE